MPFQQLPSLISQFPAEWSVDQKEWGYLVTTNQLVKDFLPLLKAALKADGWKWRTDALEGIHCYQKGPQGLDLKWRKGSFSFWTDSTAS